MTNAKKRMHGACVAALLAGGLMTGLADTSPAQQTIAPASATPVPDPLPDVLAKYASVTAERLRIVLIDRSETVARPLGPGPRPAIEAAMAAARVELRLGAAVKALAADRVSFADDSVLAADAVVLASGMVASPFAAQVPGARDELGRVVVDSALRAPAARDSSRISSLLRSAASSGLCTPNSRAAWRPGR